MLHLDVVGVLFWKHCVIFRTYWIREFSFFGLCHLTVSEKPNKAKTRSTTGISQQRYFGLFLQLDTVSIPVGSRPQTSAGRFNQGPLGSSDIQSGSLVHLFLFV